MEVEFFKWEDFKMETLHQQIAAGCVSIGFQVERTVGSGPGAHLETTTVRIHGRLGEDKDRPHHWKIFAIFEQNGNKRTMSRICGPNDVKEELERSVNTARSMMSARRPA
jgi:hypothetical protein